MCRSSAAYINSHRTMLRGCQLRLSACKFVQRRVGLRAGTQLILRPTVSLLVSVIGRIISPYLTYVSSSASFSVSHRLRGGKHAASIFELSSEALQRS